jgi:uncharacterized coiled-coil protein SlyX
MRPTKWVVTLSATLGLAGVLWAQATNAPAPGKSEAGPTTEEQVRALRDALTSQQQEIDQLRATVRRLVEATPQGDARREVSATTEPAKNAAVPPSSPQIVAQEKKLSALEQASNRFRFAGDVRLRFEPLYQDLTQPRYRPRLRARLGMESRLGEDFSGGIYLATGTLEEPISTNSTLTQSFTRKPVGLDRGWITYQPQQHRWLQMTAGKFAYTWLRTSLTFDPDLNPEGFSEKLSFSFKHPVVKNVSLTGLQLMVNEAAGSTLPFALGTDSYALGGQGSFQLQLGRRVLATFHGAALNWRNADAIVQALVSKTLIGRNTNATVGSGTTLAYKSQFLYADFIADALIQTGLERWPARLTLDFLDNPRAASSQRHGFWSEASWGRLQDRNDLQFGYAFGRIEQDAVIAPFNESEWRAPTNVLQHKLQFQWLAQKNTTASFSAWVGRTLNRNLQNAALPAGLPSTEQDPYMKRLQFELIYKF